MVKNESSQKPIPDMLMELLVCPACKGDLILTEQMSSFNLQCHSCKLSYPINDGIPIMLIDKAASII